MELKDHADEMEARREKIRAEMGGSSRIARILVSEFCSDVVANFSYTCRHALYDNHQF